MKTLFRDSVVVSLSFAVLLYAAGSSITSAAPLPPGGFLYPVPEEPEPIGGALLQQLVEPYAGADIQGTLVSSVYVGDASNPFGGLTFTYEILAGLGSIAPVESFTVGNYGPFQTDVSYNSFAGGGDTDVVLAPGLPPVYAGRTQSGNVVSFEFTLFGGPGIQGGQNSALLVIQTDVPFHTTTIASVIDAGSAEVLSLAPEPVPEPAAIALLGFGALALIMAKQRR